MAVIQAELPRSEACGLYAAACTASLWAGQEWLGGLLVPPGVPLSRDSVGRLVRNGR